MNVYFISGLAADRRVFKNIHLPQGHTAIYLDWLPPARSETLHDYAARLAEQVNDNEEFALVGLSFGGMLASEIAAIKKPSLLILISSIPASVDLPGYYRMAGKLGIHKIIPVSFLKSASFIKRFFTAETAEEKQILREMIRESDPGFIRWALKAIITWKKEDHPQHLIHIHGSKDELLPVKYTHPTHIIEKAGHLMVLRRAEEVNKILKEVLSPYTAAINT